jgi:hypothetical protein
MRLCLDRSVGQRAGYGDAGPEKRAQVREIRPFLRTAIARAERALDDNFRPAVALIQLAGHLVDPSLDASSFSPPGA